MAQQVFGGHGYIAEHGMEQFVRDARIAMIYEGANGIQALDLVGRKLPKDGGRALHGVLRRGAGLHQGARRRRRDEALSSSRSAQALGHLQQATMWFMQNAMAKPDNAGAGSTDYMHLFGLVRSATCGRASPRPRTAKLPNGAEPQRMKAKLVTGALLHGAHAAGDRRAPRAHPGRRGHDDGIAGRGVLAAGVSAGTRGFAGRFPRQGAPPCQMRAGKQIARKSGI